jgi:two-component system KDP operon response regulator KdpE
MTEAGSLVLLIEDEPPMRRFLRASLASHGFRLIEASTAKEGLEMAAQQRPALILLDLGLPDGDGIALTKTLRESSSVPIVVISARGREDDKVMALDAGADDYITKPFGVNELLARIRVAFRHAQAAEGGSTANVVDVDGLRIDFTRHVVTVTGREVHLTPIEYRLVSLLAQHAGKVLTHRHLLNEVWGPGHAEQTHYLRVRMAELRKKIEANPSQPRWLLTEPGVGYRMRSE